MAQGRKYIPGQRQPKREKPETRVVEPQFPVPSDILETDPIYRKLVGGLDTWDVVLAKTYVGSAARTFKEATRMTFPDLSESEMNYWYNRSIHKRRFHRLVDLLFGELKRWNEDNVEFSTEEIWRRIARGLRFAEQKGSPKEFAGMVEVLLLAREKLAR